MRTNLYIVTAAHPDDNEMDLFLLVEAVDGKRAYDLWIDWLKEDMGYGDDVDDPKWLEDAEWKVFQLPDKTGKEQHFHWHGTDGMIQVLPI